MSSPVTMITFMKIHLISNPAITMLHRVISTMSITYMMITKMTWLITMVTTKVYQTLLMQLTMMTGMGMKTVNKK